MDFAEGEARAEVSPFPREPARAPSPAKFLPRELRLGLAAKERNPSAFRQSQEREGEMAAGGWLPPGRSEPISNTPILPMLGRARGSREWGRSDQVPQFHKTPLLPREGASRLCGQRSEGNHKCLPSVGDFRDRRGIRPSLSRAADAFVDGLVSTLAYFVSCISLGLVRRSGDPSVLR
jgi:hypothetical protein